VNYEPGDEIFLTGFSRGAFTARSVAGLIASMGLLTRAGLVEFYPIFRDWENQLDDGYVSRWPDKPYPKHPKFLDPRYVVELEKVSIHLQVRLVIIAMRSLTPVEAWTHTAEHPHQGRWRLGNRRYAHPYEASARNPY